MNHTDRPRTRHRVALRLAAATAAAIALGAGPALTAYAGEQMETGGWVRLAHLSPDTPAVDVNLTGLAGGEARIALDDVGYGDVSAYERIPAGTYTASMVPAGAPEGTEPVITQAVDVTDGSAFTVAAVGLNKDLTGKVLDDDLTPPADGQARVRLVQAAVDSPTVDVTTVTGQPIAQDAPFGTATNYAEVEAGRWTLNVSGDSGPGTTQVDLAAGSVNTLFVLDKDGELTIESVQDSSGSAAAPTGGVDTGAGGLERTEANRGPLVAGVGSVIAVAAAAFAMTRVRRRAS